MTKVHLRVYKAHIDVNLKRVKQTLCENLFPHCKNNPSNPPCFPRNIAFSSKTETGSYTITDTEKKTNKTLNWVWGNILLLTLQAVNVDTVDKMKTKTKGSTESMHI